MRKPWLNYQHLLYFQTIAVEGGVAKAAAKLKLGQSTLSTQLAQLEDQIGVQLFERRRRRLHLTDAGRMALGYAREIFKLGDELLDALHDRRDKDRLQVQIGAVDSVPKATIAALVAAAQAHQPCAISILEGRPGELLRALKAHAIDLALFNHQPPAGERPGLMTRLVGRTPVAVLGAKKFAGLASDFPASLTGRPFVMPAAQTRLRSDLDHFFKMRSIAVDVVLEAQDTSLRALLAAQGAGLLPIGAAAAGELVASHRLKHLGDLPGIHDELWLIAGERRIENPVAAELFRTFAFS